MFKIGQFLGRTALVDAFGLGNGDALLLAFEDVGSLQWRMTLLGNFVSNQLLVISAAIEEPQNIDSMISFSYSVNQNEITDDRTAVTHNFQSVISALLIKHRKLFELAVTFFNLIQHFAGSKGIAQTMSNVFNRIS